MTTLVDVRHRDIAALSAHQLAAFVLLDHLHAGKQTDNLRRHQQHKAKNRCHKSNAHADTILATIDPNPLVDPADTQHKGRRLCLLIP
jgi:hypothetical protein